MPSHTGQQNIAVILPPPSVLGDRKTAESWFITRTPAQRQAFMNYVISTVNGMSPARKRGLSRVLAKQGLSLDMMRQSYPGMNGLSSGLGGPFELATGLLTNLYLADSAQDAAADQNAAGRALQSELNDKNIASNERMNNALIDYKDRAAQMVAESADKSAQLQTYTEVLKLQMQANKDAQRREMFGPVWAGVIKWGGLGALVIGGGATFMYMRKRRRR